MSSFGMMSGSMILLSARYPRLYCFATLRNASIFEILSNSSTGLSWNLLFSRDLLNTETDYLSSLIDSFENFRISPSALIDSHGT